MKIKELIRIIVSIIPIGFTNCSNNIGLYSTIDYKPIPKVSLEEYKSVQLRDSRFQNPNLALGVSIAGGGSRAQYYGLGVLIGLEEIKTSENTNRNFLKEIDYFSTVSGGGYAAGYYLTILKNQHLVENGDSFRKFYFSKGEKYKDFIGKSANPLLVLNNNKNERGYRYSMTERLDYEILQYDSKTSSKNENLNKFTTQMTLSNFFVAKSDTTIPTLPLFVPNGTIFNNTERIPFMPHIVESLNLESSLRPNKAAIPIGANGINNGYSFPLTYAITASSAFPGVLPKTKFGVKGSKKIICIVDGGVVDNLGYTTLLELLDKSEVEKKNKRALIIDCSGEGQIERFSEDSKIKLLPLLTATSLFTVQSKYLYHEDAIKNQICAYGIPYENSLVIGFSTLRSHLKNLPKDSNYNQLKLNLEKSKDTNKQWFNFYTSFRNSLVTKFLKSSFTLDDNNEIILSSISSDKFKEFTATDVLILYEYAAQVETKLKIFKDEREMLTLAGRYTVFLEQNKLKNLLKTDI